jgi:hypothetical protein
VRYGKRHIKEKRLILIIFYKPQGLVSNQVVRIDLFFAVLVGFEPSYLAVSPEVVGIIRMRLALTDIPKEVVKTLLVRVACGANPAETPLSECPCGITGFLEDTCYRNSAGSQRPL